MKINKSILTAALALSVLGIANADTIYVTGSTAGRSAAYLAFSTGGVVFSTTPSITTYAGTGSGATYMVFEGDIAGLGASVISCHWSGSEGGITDIAATPQVGVAFAAPPYNHLQGNTLGTTETKLVDLAFADNPSTDAAIYGNNPGTPPDAIEQEAPLGVIPFKYVRNKGLWIGNNVTSSMVRQALGGICPRSVFTGVPNQTDIVYVSGRDASSGTRVNELAECGFGQFTPPRQIEVSSAGVMQILNGTTLPSVYKGDYGYSSGGTLAGTMGSDTTLSLDKTHTPNTTGFSVIAFLGKSDSATAITAGATELSYNGVPYSNANIIEGTYTAWGTWFAALKNSPTTTAQAVYDNLLANFQGSIDGVNMISLANMHCTKDSAGADVGHN